MADDSNFLIDFSHSFSIIRMIDNILVPSNIKLRAEVLTNPESDDEDYDIAFAKIRFWFENIVSKTIVFSTANSAAYEILFNDSGFNRTANLIMLTPEEPTDGHLASLFQAKMTALSEGTLNYGAVRVSSDNITGLMFTFIGDHNEVLPVMKDWMGETPNYFTDPWWMRSDASTLDVIPEEDTDLNKKPGWAFSLDFIENAVRPPNEMIVKPGFRPTVIDGGKSD